MESTDKSTPKPSSAAATAFASVWKKQKDAQTASMQKKQTPPDMEDASDEDSETAQPKRKKPKLTHQSTSSKLEADEQDSAATTQTMEQAQVCCFCEDDSKPAALLTVLKSGENQGKKYWTCSEHVCTFFQWYELKDAVRCKCPGNRMVSSFPVKNSTKGNNGKMMYSCRRCNFFRFKSDKI